jgi:hypothetical protein
VRYVFYRRGSRIPEKIALDTYHKDQPIRDEAEAHKGFNHERRRARRLQCPQHPDDFIRLRRDPSVDRRLQHGALADGSSLDEASGTDWQIEPSGLDPGQVLSRRQAMRAWNCECGQDVEVWEEIADRRWESGESIGGHAVRLVPDRTRPDDKRRRLGTAGASERRRCGGGLSMRDGW